MRRIFWGFCINRFGIGPIHYVSSRSDFGFEFAEIFVIEKRLPDSSSWGVDKNAYRYNFFQTESESQRFPDSPSWRVAESGSRFLITNIFANSKPKAERLER
jgi:hypothetical protein